jgi:hypothetical protein
MGRHERRAGIARHKASVARYRRESEETYLVSPDEAGLNSFPILRRATQHWGDKFAVKDSKLHYL